MKLCFKSLGHDMKEGTQTKNLLRWAVHVRDHLVVTVSLSAFSLCNTPRARSLSWDQHVPACTLQSINHRKETRYGKGEKKEIDL